MEDLKYTKEVAEELGFKYEYDAPPTDVNVLRDNVMMLTVAANGEDYVSGLLSDPECPLLFQIINKRVETLGLTEYIAPSAIIMAAIYNIESPGKAIVYLIELLDYAVRNNVKVDYIAVTTSIFPDAFFTNETASNIIDKIHKLKKAKHSTVY